MKRLFGIAGLLTLGAAVGCQNKVHDENLALHQQNRQLQAQNLEMQEKVRQAPDPAQMAALQQQISERDAKITQLEADLKKPAPGAPADPALAGIETTYDPKSGALSIAIPGDVLFDSGKAMLKPTSLSTLDKIDSAVRKSYSGKAVSINGYTDRDPISKTKQQWDDNWDLSYARAKAVSNYLTDHGIDSKNIAIVAHGPNHPKATKDKSRRVEIVVMTK